MKNVEGDAQKTGARFRDVIEGWSDKDSCGETLLVNALRGSLTTTGGYRGTICKVREFEYLLRRLNGEETLATAQARIAREVLIDAIVPLIQSLHWRDFELLVELVMTQGGLAPRQSNGRRSAHR